MSPASGITHDCTITPSGGSVTGLMLWRDQRGLRSYGVQHAQTLTPGFRTQEELTQAGFPPEIAFPQKADVDANFVRLMQLLLPSGIYHGIATHDPRMIDATVDFAAKNGIGKDQFEFQMLYGIRTDLQQKLVRNGYQMRLYIPYGSDWFPYFMRRLAERPANVAFILRNLFR